ncbi:MAG: hypothetical protein WCI72_03215 [archaeon]
MLNNKKIFLSFVGALFLSLFVLNFVSAYGYSFVGSIDSIAYQIQPIAQFFLGGYDYTGYMLFERFLFFIIILSITFVALVKAPFFENQKNVVIVLSIVVPLLSVRYIDFQWINTILMSYQVFGIALTAFIPFVIYFFFLMGIAPTQAAVRKVGWVFFMCVYVGLYATAENQFYGQVYIWTALIAFFFLLADGTINRIMLWNKVRESGKATLMDAEIAIRRRMQALATDLTNKVIDRKYYDVQMKELMAQQKMLFKHSIA